MNARTKLNRANIAGSVVVAAVIGGLAGSWPVFFVVTAILLGLSLSDGSIRLTSRRK